MSPFPSYAQLPLFGSARHRVGDRMMLFGLQLHAERGADAVLHEARLADQQGFHSVWTGDHLLGIRGDPAPDRPLETWSLMCAIGAQTSRVQLAFATLNPSFRNPALLAKMLSTLDQITHGRVICTLGAGWYEAEYRAYNIPFIEDHDERIRQEREVALLLKQLWTHPAPALSTFEGEFVAVRDLPFNPAPHQEPHPPIWIGGNSATTQAVVKEVADGWILLSATDPRPLVEAAMAEPDWPNRPMAIVSGAVQAADESTTDFARRATAMGEWGATHVRLTFPTLEHQAAFAAEVLSASATSRL